LLFEDGATIGANVPILRIKAGAAAAAAAPAAQAPKPATPSSKPAAEPVQPKAEPVAAKKEIPTSQPEVPQVPKAPISRTPISQIPVTPLQTESSGPVDITKIGGTRAETRVKMSKMRQTVASRLKTAQNTCAMLTTFNEINMGLDIFCEIHFLKQCFYSLCFFFFSSKEI
jgi:2-oxoglutarate dehydrogenase E2 component (dihydrolipoamide succinyltransferase)